MLLQVLKEIENSQGGMRLDGLSRRLGIDAGVLEGMVEHWVRKGRIQRVGSFVLCSTDACSTCRGCERHPAPSRS